MTDCNQQSFPFQDLGSRTVVVDFNAGHTTSDAGAVLLREFGLRTGIIDRLSECFTDLRDQRFVQHPVAQLVAQRVYGLALGYEDINDHETLRFDPAMALICEKANLPGQRASNPAAPAASCPAALAGKSTINRFELGAADIDTRYKKIGVDEDKVADLLLEEGIKSIPKNGQIIIIDLDATDDPLHGQQEGRFFHGYYDSYCYLPLYAFCGSIPLVAKLRTADRDGADGALEEVQRIVKAIRERHGKKVKIIVRADSGFCRDEMLSWIECQRNVFYVTGLARNARLEALSAPALARLKEQAQAAVAASLASGNPDECPPLREFAEFNYRTLNSWSRSRRVIAKAEWTRDKANPRYILTNIRGDEEWLARHPELNGKQALYEKFYCGRGDMENRIKEQQMDMFGDRTSTEFMKSNQLRLWFSTFAYLMISRLRAEVLHGTELACATAGTIRLRLFKIGALVRVSVRRIHLSLSSYTPSRQVFITAWTRLQAMEC